MGLLVNTTIIAYTQRLSVGTGCIQATFTPLHKPSFPLYLFAAAFLIFLAVVGTLTYRISLQRQGAIYV